MGRPLSSGRRLACWIALQHPRWWPTAPDEHRLQAIAALRRLGFTGPELAELLQMPLSTVSGILTRIGMGRLGRLGLEPARRYERARPGELIHIDVKKLRRMSRPGWRMTGGRKSRGVPGYQAGGRGWEFCHVAIDDCTRLAYAEVLADERATTAIGFLRRAVAFYRSYGIAVERVLTDNGNAYRSAVHAIACRALSIRHMRTRSAPQPALESARTLLGIAVERAVGPAAEQCADESLDSPMSRDSCSERYSPRCGGGDR
jgi:Integrase core domain